MLAGVRSRPAYVARICPAADANATMSRAARFPHGGGALHCPSWGARWGGNVSVVGDALYLASPSPMLPELEIRGAIEVLSSTAVHAVHRQ